MEKIHKINDCYGEMTAAKLERKIKLRMMSIEVKTTKLSVKLEGEELNYEGKR